MYLILERSKHDVLYKGEYLIYIKSVSEIPRFIREFLKRNKIRLRGEIDISFLKQNVEPLLKRRKEKRRYER